MLMSPPRAGSRFPYGALVPLAAATTRVFALTLVASIAMVANDARASDADEPLDVAEVDDADVPADTLAAVRARGELRWGADAQGGAPFIFQDPRDPNHIIGFEVDVADALAHKLGVRAVPVQGPWDRLIELMARGDFDIALNGIEVTDDKKGVCLLSTPYYVAAERLTVRKGDDKAPRSLETVKGHAVGTLPGSLAERILLRSQALVRTYDGGQDDIYKDLLLGRTDAVLLDDPITSYYGAIEPALEVVEGSFGEVSYAVALRDQTMQRAVNDAFLELASDGTLRRIYEKWGLWNAQTAKLLGDDDAIARGVPDAWESWRATVGTRPPFLQRVIERYPAMMPMFFKGAALTLLVCVLAMVFAILLGLLLAVARSFGPRPVRWLATLYVEIFRGTPLLVQLTMIYFGLPELGITLSPFWAGVIALGLNYAAAESENYRAGLLSVPASQLDAARVLGLSTPLALRYVVMPQAARVALPPMTNDFIALLKDSSLVSIVTLTELTKTYGILASSTRDHLGLGLVVACWYLLIGLPFVLLSRFVEARLGKGSRRTGGT